MKDKTTKIYVKFLLMPLIIKLLTLFGFMGILFVIAAIIPITNYYVNDTKISFEQFWSMGYGLQVLSMGILLFSSGLTMYMQKRISGILFSIALIIGHIPINETLNIEYLITLIFLLGFLCWYFLFKPSVINYFRKESKREKT